jgi:drug/metabolite transporter (DMT)-like permease
MLVSGIPIATATVAAILMRRAPGVRQRIGLAIGFFGILLLSSPTLSGATGSAVGIGYVLLAVSCYGINNNLLVPLQQRYGSMAVTLRTLAVASVALLPIGVLGLNRSSFEWVPVVAVVILGIVGTGVARATQLALAGRVGAARGSVVAYLVPIVALALGFLVLDERVEPIQVVGVAVTILGAYLVSRSES